MGEEKRSKKELIELRHNQEQNMWEKEEQKKKLYIRGGVVIGVLLILLLGWWAVIESMKPAAPLPGKEFADLGADHIENIAGFTYSSNPPTSGSHFVVWAKRGVYPYEISDGHLLHALEHGYIVISYNCGDLAQPVESLTYDAVNPLTKTTFGKESTMAFFTPENVPKKVTELSESFSSKECQTLVKDLSSFLDDWQRVIVVPRPNLDSKIALTAWRRMEKLQAVDKEKITTFISSFHNAGPEKTVE
ncbi:MAG TPA: DUF3105 domain-containing protein [Patescibacteria group bacterium]|nr:DUF3105 domain-containing protein [Patescibacteria group bacterium]